MQLIRIHNISDLKLGDKIAIANSDKNFKDLIGNSVNLTTGEVIDCTNTSVLVSTKERNLIITNITLQMQAVYSISEFLSIGSKSIQNEIKLERKLRKAEKLNKRYEAILTKKFYVTEEQLKNNFSKNKKTNSRFYTYKTQFGELPFIKNGEFVTLSSRFVFKKNSKNHIICEISVFKGHVIDNEILVKDQGIAICHKDDEFSEEIGELIASAKAIKNVTCKLY